MARTFSPGPRYCSLSKAKERLRNQDLGSYSAGIFRLTMSMVYIRNVLLAGIAILIKTPIQW